MALCRPPQPAKLIVAMLSGYREALAEAQRQLLQLLGPLDLSSEAMEHGFTDYYRDEMGDGLLRYFVAREQLIDPAELSRIKRRTNEIEQAIAESGQFPGTARPVNLDPGYVTPAKFVLASCKDYTHRIYLGDGVYAECTLGYTRGSWQCYDWTYPDYRSAGHQDFLTRARNRLMEQLRHQAK